jgi:hypothetical protein
MDTLMSLLFHLTVDHLIIAVHFYHKRAQNGHKVDTCGTSCVCMARFEKKGFHACGGNVRIIGFHHRQVNQPQPARRPNLGGEIDGL